MPPTNEAGETDPKDPAIEQQKALGKQARENVEQSEEEARERQKHFETGPGSEVASGVHRADSPQYTGTAPTREEARDPDRVRGTEPGNALAPDEERGEVPPPEH